MKSKVQRFQVPKMSDSEGRTLDWSKAQKVVFPELKASTETISLSLPTPGSRGPRATRA